MSDNRYAFKGDYNKYADLCMDMTDAEFALRIDLTNDMDSLFHKGYTIRAFYDGDQETADKFRMNFACKNFTCSQEVTNNLYTFGQTFCELFSRPISFKFLVPILAEDTEQAWMQLQNKEEERLILDQIKLNAAETLTFRKEDFSENHKEKTYDLLSENVINIMNASAEFENVRQSNIERAKIYFASMISVKNN